MNGTEIELKDMLLCRERRAYLQSGCLAHYHRPVISFCMNIPGPVKTNAQIRRAFESGQGELLSALQKKHIAVLWKQEIHENTGDELILCADAPAEVLKDLTTDIEEHHVVGRLFDMDVIGTDGNKLSRPSFRRCIVCGKQAQECARSRTHTVPELQAAVERLLGEMDHPQDC